MRTSYNTANRKKCIEFLAAFPQTEFTVESLFAAMTDGGIAIGKSSLYRMLEKLCTEGVVRRFVDEEKDSALYRYIGDDSTCAHHLHLKCVDCGKLIHLECDMSGELVDHIKDEHGFAIDSKKSVLYGKCRDCEAKTK